MTVGTLEATTRDFVSILNNVVEAAIDTDVRFTAGFKPGGKRAGIDASRSYAGIAAFPLVRASDEDRVAPALLLRARYIVETVQPDGALRVAGSTVGLWVDVTGGRKKHRPLVRLEYNRNLRAADSPAAHVHLHANSPEMAWVYGSSGRAAPDLHALHFPVGGQPFRPTLEDFLLFLNQEELYTNFKPNWKHAVLRSLRAWEAIQAASTVKKYPETAVDALEKLGYAVSPAADDGTA